MNFGDFAPIGISIILCIGLIWLSILHGRVSDLSRDHQEMTSQITMLSQSVQQLRGNADSNSQGLEQLERLVTQLNEMCSDRGNN